MSHPGADDQDEGEDVNGGERERRAEQDLEAAASFADEVIDEELDEEPSFFDDRRRIVQTLLAVLILIAAIYFLFPKLVGVEDGIELLGDGDPVWIGVALGFAVAMFGAYVGLFRGVVGENVLRLSWNESYQITMAGLAATRLFSAGGAGGIVLTYWALRKAGMPRRQSAARMVAFLVLVYAVYMFALIVCGVTLRTGLLSGKAPAGLTIVPAIVAGVIVVGFLLIALIPGDVERRLARGRPQSRAGRIAIRLATVPATLAVGTRIAIDFIREPSRGGLAIAGAIGFWATQIGILWASFEAFGASVPFGILVQGFFVGMLANLIPFAPGGVGAVDAGMIGTFVLFGIPGAPVFAAVLCYRVIAFWLPLPPGVVAFLQLRRTVARWETEREVMGQSDPMAAAAAGRRAPITSLNEV